jgi:hypothetical protein
MEGVMSFPFSWRSLLKPSPRGILYMLLIASQVGAALLRVSENLT